MFPPYSREAFSRIELLAICTVFSLIALVVAPASMSSKSETERFICLNNLRQMGRAVQMWGTEHHQDPPWRTRFSDGGTLPDSGSKPGNAWFEFFYLSNELATPRILACPRDSSVRVASDFSEYGSATFRANATSYFINLHTLSSRPAAAVFGDRDVRFNSGGTCPYANNTVTLQFPMGPAPNIWSNAVHGGQGNLVLMDGNALPTTSAQASSILQKSDPGTAVHFLRAR